MTAKLIVVLFILSVMTLKLIVRPDKAKVMTLIVAAGILILLRRTFILLVMTIALLT